MGTNTRARRPGPVGGPVTPLSQPIAGLLRNPRLSSIADDIKEAYETAVQLFNSDKMKNVLAAIYDAPKPDDKDEEGNIRDPANARLPSTRRDKDARRPVKSPRLKLKNPDFDVDSVGIGSGGFKLEGNASLTLEIPTDYPAQFDTPTDVAVKITSALINRSETTIKGSATAYQVLHADFTLHLQYDEKIAE